MKHKIVFHSADLDGFCSGAIVKRAIVSKGFRDVEMIGWDYGQEIPEIDHEAMYILTDISFPPDAMEMLQRSTAGLIWIDHHKTAIDAAKGRVYENCLGMRKVGDSASLLAWRYFNISKTEPEIVYWVDRYDVWKQGEDWDTVMKFQYGARHHLHNPQDDRAFDKWCYVFDGFYLVQVKNDGEVILAYEKHSNVIRCTKAFDLVFEGHKFAAINNPTAGSSTLNSYRRFDHDGLMVFSYNGKGKWNVSMYKNELSAQEVDLSVIAVKYGGGGHAGACGFMVDDITTVIGK